MWPPPPDASSVVAKYLVLFPLVRPLRFVVEMLPVSQPATEEEREEEQEEDVEAFIEVGEREGILEANEGEMMRSIVDLDETVVREIMTPRTDIVALPEATTVAEARRVILEAGHSRLPVYRDSIDNVIGVLHERDLLQAKHRVRPPCLLQVVCCRPPTQVARGRRQRSIAFS